MKAQTSIYNTYVIVLNKIHDRAGNITVIEEKGVLPFIVKRLYYLYDVPSGSERGGHAHRDLHHFMIAASGSFDVVLDDGNKKKVIELNRPDYGVYIPPKIWVEVINFSAGAVSLNFVSDKYNEEDYIRDYHKFLKLKRNENTSII